MARISKYIYIAEYKCGCTEEAKFRKDLLNYCGKHGDNLRYMHKIANMDNPEIKKIVDSYDTKRGIMSITDERIEELSQPHLKGCIHYRPPREDGEIWLEDRFDFHEDEPCTCAHYERTELAAELRSLRAQTTQQVEEIERLRKIEEAASELRLAIDVASKFIPDELDKLANSTSDLDLIESAVMHYDALNNGKVNR